VDDTTRIFALTALDSNEVNICYFVESISLVLFLKSREECAQVGISVYLSKPISREILGATLVISKPYFLFQTACVDI
jgi:CheY-like chemotaxis protein